jgi:hypothetical protein
MVSASFMERRRLGALLRPIDWLRDRGASGARAWNKFWFTPVDPAPLCLMRILVGGMLVYSHWVWGLELAAFLGEEGWNSAELVRAVQRDSWALSFWWFVPAGWYAAVHAGCLAILALFWAGCWTRITSVLSFVILVSYCNRAPLSNYGLDQISSILTLYLSLGPSGARYSVDRVWRRRTLVPDSATACMALRLVQIHYCIIYFFAGVSKLQGRSWWTGEAMWRAFANYEYQSTDMTWLAADPGLLQLMTIATLLWEISFAYLVWNRSLRPWLLAGGLAMHFGIGACLGMWTFGLMMMFGYVAFLSPETVRRVMGGMRRRREVIEAAADVNDGGAAGSSGLEGCGRMESAAGPVVLCLHSDEEFRTVLTRYLQGHSFVVAETGLIEEVPELLASRRVDAILFAGHGRSADEIEAFHAAWKEAESDAVVAYFLKRPLARQLKPVLKTRGSVIVPLPASLRLIRQEISRLLARGTADKAAGHGGDSPGNGLLP